MSKGKKAVIIIVAIVVVLAVAAGIVLMPRHGKTVADTWSPYDTYGGQKWIRTIEKQPGKDFKILQITDTQLYMLPGDNKKALELTKELVTEEKPDLVVLTGDNVSALFTDWLIDDVIDCMESLGVPWAPVYGNHDGEGKADLKWQGEQFMKAEHCLYQPGPSNLTGEGNYIINVTENGKVIQSLILMDSGNHDTYGDGSGEETSAYAYIHYDQIEWYKWAIRSVSAQQYGSFDPADGKVVESMAFFHIALPEMKEALLPYLDENGLVEVPEQLGFGAIREGIACPPLNSGLFDAMKELGSTKNIFFGHDHANDASIVYEGIRMTYGVKTGPSPKPWNDAVAYGGTRITLKDADHSVRVEHIYKGGPEK